MAHQEHRYSTHTQWTGNRGSGTSGYRDYDRDHVITAGTKPALPGSADPAFRGDPARWNPEELLVAALAACHQLWSLHLCAEAGVIVTAYSDDSEGVMADNGMLGGHFVSAALRPRVTVAAGSDAALAERLHREAHAKCFIARSVNFPVTCEPTIVVAD